MNLRNIGRTLAPLAAGAMLAAGVSVMPANAAPAQAAPLQFTATVQAPNRILTSQHLFKNEHLTVNLDGFKEVVVAVQNNGGGTVAWLKYPLPQQVCQHTQRQQVCQHPLTPVLFTVH
jgi:hypothetical protein